jgi:hypothetical protein
MEAWIAAYGEAEGLARSARSCLRVVEANGGENSSEEAVKVRRLLGRLQQAGDELDNDLISLEMDGRVTAKEVARRKEQLAHLSSERRLLTQQLSAATAAAASSTFSSRASLPVLSSAEARQLNSVSVRAQESLLDDLGSSLRRQHSLGHAMGREVDEQQVKNFSFLFVFSDSVIAAARGDRTAHASQRRQSAARNGAN